MMRNAKQVRHTTETQIDVELLLDGTGVAIIDTGIGFFDHMLTLFAKHGRFDLTIRAKGDLHVDAHHTVEDVGIVLGQVFHTALGDMRGITRYGTQLLPMDEALVQVALDISGRSHVSLNMSLPNAKLGEFDTELVSEFLLGLSRHLGLTLHVTQLAGTNTHHIIEAAFKALGRALSEAVRIDPRFAGEIPSTKGCL